MASIIKRTYSAVVNGRTVTRTCKHWTIQYRDPAGRIKRVKGYTDKGATKQLAAKLEAQQARGEQGLLDPFRVHRRRPIAEHVTDYVADLRTQGCSEKYVSNVGLRLSITIEGTGWGMLENVDGDSFTRWRNTLKRNPRKGTRVDLKAQGTSAETLNQYLETARAFTNWCATKNRMAGVPKADGKKLAIALAGVTPVAGEKRRKRRALDDAQLAKLLTLFPDRALVYRFGIATGLRRSEIEALAWGDVRLNAIIPYLQLRAEATKAGRADRVPLPQTLAQDLRLAKPANAKDGARVFAEVPSLDQWKEDLATAGIPYLDDMGRQLDFHGGCRQTLCTHMHRQGIPQREAMRRMRVTDPRLLNDVYADDVQLAGLMAPLSEVVAPPPGPPAAAAQGA